MKILMILHFVPYPPHGGSLQRTFNLLREASKGNDIHLVALSQKALHPDDKILSEAVGALEEFCNSVTVFPIPSDASKLRWYSLLLLNLLSREPYSVWRFKSPDMAENIQSLAAAHKFDLVHLDTVELAQYAHLAPGVPTVVNHHNVESSLLLRRATSEGNFLARLYLGLQGCKLKRYEQEHAPRFAANLAVSQNDKELFESYISKARFEVVANGTDVEYFTPRNASEAKELVFAGGMNWYPNRDAMIHFCEDIFPLIKKQVPDTIMNVVGGSPPRRVLACSKKDPSIKVHGYVEDVRVYLARSAVYVVPIRIGGGTRLKILDAFACGKAVVSSAAGCEGIQAVPGRDILVGDTPDEFAAQVVRLLNDHSLRQSLEANARKVAEEKYSWQVIGKILRDVYQSVIR